MSRFVVPRRVLDATTRALAEPGQQGLEAVVLWIGRAADEDDLIEIIVEYMPPQVAYRSDDGVAVTVPDWAIAELISALPDGLFVPVRVHTHPGPAYHSAQDDTNMLISHQGAISIVVPDFARRPMDLSHCSVNELDASFRWTELGRREVTERFLIQ